MKPIVHYHSNKYHSIELGHGARVWPIDHPNRSLVSNASEVLTSEVVSLEVSATGKLIGFTTRNTVYRGVP